DGRLGILGTGCGGFLKVTASVSSTTTDPDSTNNSATATTQIKPLPPTITNFPGSASLGSIFTIGGTNFDDPRVTVNGIPAHVISHSDTQINALVTPGATSGPIAIVTPGGSVTNATQFTVLAALTA